MDGSNIFTPDRIVSASGTGSGVAGRECAGSGESVSGESPATQHFLLLGICGAGMRSLAEILLDRGHRVTGTDSLLRPQSRPGEDDRPSYRIPPSVQIVDWENAAQILAQSRRSLVPAMGADPVAALPIDIVVASTAVPDHDERLQCAARMGLTVRWLPQQLAESFRGCHQVCVAGTHGKSTTTGLVSWIIRSAGMRPGLFLGGVMLNGLDRRHSGSPADAASPGHINEPLAIIESCEYRGAFLNFSPRTAVLTGIERDHFDCYPTPQSEDHAFLQFARKVPQNGRLIVNADCSRSQRVARQLKTGIITFAMDSAADWTARHVAPEGSGTAFDLIGHGDRHGRVRLQLPGIHNVRNVLAAVATAASLGVEMARILSAVESFSGIQRRFERRGDWNGMALIDDYAHHPGAIRATLQAARAGYPGRRLIAVCEPHQLSRTNALFSELCTALLQADEVLILPVLAAREKATRGECLRAAGRIVRSLNLQGGRAFLMADLDQVTARLDHSGRPGDVIITMGAGRTYEIHDEFNRRLQRDRAA